MARVRDMAYSDQYMRRLATLLESLSPTDFDLAVNLLRQAGAAGGKVILAGNGASAAMASHIAVDLTKVAGLRAVTFNEADLITCFANDFGYEHWISKALEFYADPKDTVEPRRFIGVWSGPPCRRMSAPCTPTHGSTNQWLMVPGNSRRTRRPSSSGSPSGRKRAATAFWWCRTAIARACHIRRWFGTERPSRRSERCRRAWSRYLVPAEPGTIVAFNDRLVHGGAVNRGETTRASAEITLVFKEIEGVRRHAAGK